MRSSIRSSMKRLIILAGAMALGVLGTLTFHSSKQATEPFVATASSDFVQQPHIFVGLAKKAVPSVVNISTLAVVKNPYGAMRPDDLFRKFFGPNMGPFGGPGSGGEDEEEGPPSRGKRGGRPEPKAMSLGTGFIIDASGLILTNNHVVAGASEIKVHFTERQDEKPTDAEVVGKDPELDLALIRVKTKEKLVPIALGDSDKLEVGEYVMAVGNPFGQGHTVTHGIISAKGRSAPEFQLANYLQTDAPINPGNSGGPLVNLQGEVIGINNAIDARAQGIGFAIPINLVKQVLPQLKTKGSVARGYIGMTIEPLTPEVAEKIGVPKDLSGPFVTQVMPGEPAEKAGIEAYDVILSINGQALASPSDLIRAVTAIPIGQKAKVKVNRAGKIREFDVEIKERPLSPRFKEPNGSGPKKEKSKKPRQIDTGMQLEDLTPALAQELGVPESLKGAVVADLEYDGPADRAGLMRGDVVVDVDKKPVKSVEEFYSIVKKESAYLLRVRRGGAQGGFTVLTLNLKR